jgi:quercetin dioxygenase-like cupin family protein
VTLDELDGVAAAPNNHKVIFENHEVRVIETRIAAGEVTPLHTHLAPTLMYVVSGSHFIRRDEGGRDDVRHAGDARFRPAQGDVRGDHTKAHDREHG